MRSSQDETNKKIWDLLTDLSGDESLMSDSSLRAKYYKRLEEIYYNPDGENYRHYYSNIFACLSVIESDSSVGDIVVLAENLETIKKGYKAVNKDSESEIIDVHTEIIKLYDHVSLEVQRILYTRKLNAQVSADIRVNSTRTEDLQAKLTEARTDLENTNREINIELDKIKETVEGQKKLQSEYITILGIFAAIVLAFTGGMSFSGSVLNNINSVSPFRLVVIVLLLGVVLFDLLWLLIGFLREINGYKDYKLKMFIYVNVFILACLIITLCIYKTGWIAPNSVSGVSVNYTP